jgi:uncharacterized repeat protein (TIGR01451 family)
MTESKRPSRQEFVVPQKASSLPMVLGACACACAGFGLVWGLGIGRSRPIAIEPAAFPTEGETAQALPVPAEDRDADATVTPTADVVAAVVPAAAESSREKRPLSRFSTVSAELPLTDNPLAEESREEEDEAEPQTRETADQEDPAPVTPPAAIAPARVSTVPAPFADDDGGEPAEMVDEAADAPGAEAPSPPPFSAPPPAFSTPPPQVTATTAVSPPAAAFGSPPFAAPVAPPPPAPLPASAAGQGRPGPAQLEGTQTPQVTVEKRGPREVQVGKPARYEIVVRNVGSAIAHDVVLRDAIPAGTTLVTTTPPATPGPSGSGSSGDLLWLLGALGPGNETKVAMEVMPEAEGEIGSVASVSFRADASIRSRATKPALQVVATPPKAVLIGKPIDLSITVSNPGTGTATGVVLEGMLPEGVTHRAGRELELDVGQLRPGDSRTIDLSLATSGPGVHAMKLVARADGRLEVEQTVPLEVTAPTLDIAAEMPARRYLQRPATCRITMTNAGTAPAKAVELATQLPPGMKFVRANNAGYYDERTHRVLWSLEELPAGDAGTVELVVMPVALGPQKFVTAARNPEGLSDQVASTIEVEGLAALTFEVVDSEDPIEVDGQTEYVVRVGNQGTKAASGVRLSATLLGDMEMVAAKGPAAHRIENLTVLFEPLARLAPSEEAVFRVRVCGRRAGDQRMQVQITSDDHPAPITKEEITRVYADR